MTTESTGPGERLYLHDDADMEIVANPNPEVVERHVARYEKAGGLTPEDVGVQFWLDLGCGSGYGTELLAKVCHFALGCDADAKAIHYATKHHREGQPPWSPWFWCWNHIGIHGALHRANAFPDVVVCIETLEHLGQMDQGLLVCNVADLLSRSPHPDTATFILAVPLGASGPNPLNPWHLHEPTELELEQLLGQWFEGVEQESVEHYESTAGETASQAWYRCRIPTP